MKRALLLVALLAVACEAEDGAPLRVTSNETRASEPRSDNRARRVERDFDDLNALIDKRFPGFAGLSVDERAGTMTIYFSGHQKPDLRRLTEEIERRLEIAGLRPVLEPVRYSFRELKQWYDRFAHKALGLRGAWTSDIDEGINRIVIGVANVSKWGPRVEAIAKRQGMPRNMLVIEKAYPIKALAERA